MLKNMLLQLSPPLFSTKLTLQTAEMVYVTKEKIVLAALLTVYRELQEVSTVEMVCAKMENRVLHVQKIVLVLEKIFVAMVARKNHRRLILQCLALTHDVDHVILRLPLKLVTVAVMVHVQD